MVHPPKSLQPILWSVDVNRLDVNKDKGYIIHQVLIYGTLEEIHWLFRVYSKKEIVTVFLKQPVKQYPKEIFYFVKNYILGLQNTNLDQENYVTSVFGPVRPRTSSHI